MSNQVNLVEIIMNYRRPMVSSSINEYAKFPFENNSSQKSFRFKQNYFWSELHHNYSQSIIG